jgi:DNA-binding NtrC family response regulator
VPINLLVIDDEETIRSLWCEIFTGDERYVINTARSGEEGVSKIKKTGYDIVVTDLNMPGGMSGLDVVKTLKEIKPETEIIMMTAYGTIELAVKAMKEGAYEFILKPLDFGHIDFVLQKCYQQIMYKKENEDLKEINVKLKELNEEKGKFIAITSHELRTPTSKEKL